MKRVALLAGALALAVASPAQAACIDSQTISAARLHEFETMMMAVSLRCSRIGINMRGNFDNMLTANRLRFDQAGALVQRFFGAAAKHGGSYDRYSTTLANKYGGGSTTTSSCKLLDGVAVELAKAVDGGKILIAVAEAMIRHSALEDTACPAP